MAAHALEIILSRQLADCLTVPIFITDPAGNLLYYNEPAEEILGRRFEETGPMAVEEWSTIFHPMDDDGHPFPTAQLPLVRTLRTKDPAHGSFWIKGLDQKLRHLAVTSYPIIGRNNHYSGAMAIFWVKEER